MLIKLISDEQHGIAPQHLQRCIALSQIVGMFGDLTDQLCCVRQWCGRALPKNFNVVADGRNVYSRLQSTMSRKAAVHEKCRYKRSLTFNVTLAKVAVTVAYSVETLSRVSACVVRGTCFRSTIVRYFWQRTYNTDELAYCEQNFAENIRALC